MSLISCRLCTFSDNALRLLLSPQRYFPPSFDTFYTLLAHRAKRTTAGAASNEFPVKWLVMVPLPTPLVPS